MTLADMARQTQEARDALAKRPHERYLLTWLSKALREEAAFIDGTTWMFVVVGVRRRSVGDQEIRVVAQTFRTKNICEALGAGIMEAQAKLPHAEGWTLFDPTAYEVQP